jgi:hypothetical protein
VCILVSVEKHFRMSFIPSLKVFESTIMIRLIIGFDLLIWKISSDHRVVEDIRTSQMHKLEQASPPLLWVEGSRGEGDIIPGSMHSLFPAELSKDGNFTTTDHHTKDLSNTKQYTDVGKEGNSVHVGGGQHEIVMDLTADGAIDEEVIILDASSPPKLRVQFEKTWFDQLKDLYSPN